MTTKLNQIARLALVPTALATVLAAPVHAQERQVDFSRVTTGGETSAPEHGASNDLHTSVAKAQISSEDEIVSVNFSLDLTVQHSAAPSTGINSSISTVSLKASLPLNSTKDKTPVDFKTFGNDGKVTFGFNHYASKFARPAPIQDYDKFGRVCVDEAGKKWLAGMGPRATQAERDALSNYLAAYDKNAADGVPFFAILDLQKGGGEFAALAESTCKLGGLAGIGNENQLAEKYGRTALGDAGFSNWRKRFFDPQHTIFFGTEGSVGFNRFSVADRTSLSVIRVDRIGFDLNAHVGLVLGNAHWVFLLTGGYARNYKAQPLVDVCGPPDSSGKSLCINGQDGLPKRTDTGYATGTVRKVLLRNKNGEPLLGIRPSITYILQDKDWQFELPIYIQRNSSGGLDAGIKIIYNTGQSKAGIGAFVGVPF